MGIYAVNCAVCTKPFQWFSGSPNQVCPDCSAVHLKSDEQLAREILNDPLKAEEVAQGAKKLLEDVKKHEKFKDLSETIDGLINKMNAERANEWAREQIAKSRGEDENSS